MRRMMSLIIEEVVTPDQGTLSRQTEDRFQENHEISYSISQEVSVKEDSQKNC